MVKFKHRFNKGDIVTGKVGTYENEYEYTVTSFKYDSVYGCVVYFLKRNHWRTYRCRLREHYLMKVFDDEGFEQYCNEDKEVKVKKVKPKRKGDKNE